MKKIKLLAENYDASKTNSTDTNERLVALVDKYGFEAVSIASGLKTSSLVVYTSKSNPPKVAERTVTKAESVLSKV